MMTILLSFEKNEITEFDLARVKQLAPEANMVITKDSHEIKEISENVTIAAGWIHPDLLFSMPNLEWYQQSWVGVDWLLHYPEALEYNFILTNTSGTPSVCVSEQVFAYLLAFARNMPSSLFAQHNRVWQPSTADKVFELAGKTMVLIGVGSIGARTARLAAAFDIKIIGVDHNPLIDVAGVENIVGPERLLETLPEADIVVLTIPYTLKTKYMIGKEELARMKSSAYLINIGRGLTVSESDLIEALESGSIAGAGLDVFETEPLSKDSPLWEMENVLITAHCAGTTPIAQKRIMLIFLENLRRFQAGEPLHNVVDKRRGY